MSHPVVLLTGAAHGIGRATARALAERGYTLALIDRDHQPLFELAQEIGGTAATADVRLRDEVHSAVASLQNRVGPIEFLLACAGVGGLSTLHNLELSAFQAMLEVNVLGVAHTIEAVLPGMIARSRGHLVVISSVAGYRGLPWMPGYSASKAALSTYLEGLRPALKIRGIGVTTIYPGFVRTRLTDGTPFRRSVAMLEPEEAATYIVRAMERRPRDFVFPWNARFGMGMLRHMPNRIFDWMMDRAGPKALDIDF